MYVHVCEAPVFNIKKIGLEPINVWKKMACYCSVLALNFLLVRLIAITRLNEVGYSRTYPTQNLEQSN